MKTSVFLILLFLSSSFNIQAQEFPSAVSYMNHMSEQYSNIGKEQWDYIRAATKGRNARKVENKRSEVMQSIKHAKYVIGKMPSFEGNKSFRDSTILYLDMSYRIMNEDYAKIVDLEEIAEQSYDLMEAYLEAKKQANEKQAIAFDLVKKEEENFAANFNINLVNTESRIGKRLRTANSVYEYYNKLYLIFFKCYKQEVFMLDALSIKDINAAEQNRSALSAYASQGLDSLKQYNLYKTDRSLSSTSRNLLNYYKEESDVKTPTLIAFYLQNEKFDKIKKNFDQKKPKSRTQQDIDQYNKEITNLNNMVNQYNSTNEYLNKRRSSLIDSWNKTSKTFLSKHIL